MKKEQKIKEQKIKDVKFLVENVNSAKNIAKIMLYDDCGEEYVDEYVDGLFSDIEEMISEYKTRHHLN